jgi:hypothetical protein
VALVASLGLLRPQILSLEAVLFKGGRSPCVGLLMGRRWQSSPLPLD